MTSITMEDDQDNLNDEWEASSDENKYYSTKRVKG
jgi:hypothetical protein